MPILGSYISTGGTFLGDLFFDLISYIFHVPRDLHTGFSMVT